jgi:hypothetical protein
MPIELPMVEDRSVPPYPENSSTTPNTLHPTTLPSPIYPTERFKNIELEINTVCDLACFSCDRMSDVAAKGVPNMTVAQVRLFVEESLDLRWNWERIRLLGGEPTLHPNFLEIVGELVRYRNVYPKVFLQVLTNGLGKSAQYRNTMNGLRISLHAETKQRGVTPRWFNNTRIVPLDRDPNVGEIEPCGIFGLRGCGIGLTRHGYFLDGAGASIARVAGHDIGVMKLEDVTWESMLGQAKILCRICGHWNPPTGEQVTKRVTETGEVTGKYWTETLARYKERKPVLRVYGRDSSVTDTLPYG